MSSRSPLSSNDSGTEGKSQQKKKGGGYLARQAKAKKTVGEDELNKRDIISPEDVLLLTKRTSGKLREKLVGF